MVGNDRIRIAGIKEGCWGSMDMARSLFRSAPENHGAMHGVPHRRQEVPRAQEVLGICSQEGLYPRCPELNSAWEQHILPRTAPPALSLPTGLRCSPQPPSSFPKTPQPFPAWQ